MRPLLVAVLALSAAWTLSAPAAGSSHEPILIDPAGDAYENSPEDTAWRANDACWGTLGLGETCAPLAPPEDLPRTGTPAPPGLDIVEIHMRDTPDHLVVELHVARLDAGLSDALPRDGTAIWAVCWGESSECAFAAVFRTDGQIDPTAYVGRFDPACGSLPVCLAPVPVDFRAGTPGSIAWTIPRALLNASAMGDTVPNVTARTGTYEGAEWVDWGVVTPLRSPSGWYSGGWATPDEASGGRAFRFSTPSASSYDGIAQTEREDLEGEAPSPETDIRRVRYVENETTFTMAIEMGRVNATAPGFSLGGVLGFGNGPALQIRVDHDGERRDARASRCGDNGCTYRVQAPARFEYVEGSPGWINVSFDRHDLDHPPRGTRVSISWVSTSVDETTTVDTVPAVRGEVVRQLSADALAFGPIYVLRHDSLLTEADLAEHQSNAVVIRDRGYDAASEQPAIDTASGMYDLVLATVEGTSPTSSRVTIGVRDLSRITLPAGAKAVTYSVALETAQGTTMVGFYRDAGRGEFFCSSDTLVFAEEKQDPADAAWTTLEGVLSIAREGGGGAIAGGSTSPSTLTIFVPHSCFGTDTPGEIPGRAFAAAIHVIPQQAVAGVPLQRIEMIDEARDESVTAFALGTALPAAPAAPWYARPFGIDGFWDISGILLAVALALLGFVAVRRKRGALRRYLQAIDLANGLPPSAREAALVDLRRRAKEDLVRGGIADAHFLVVEQRVNDELLRSRSAELGQAFGDLPHRLMQKLLDMLGDGTITRDEARRFSALLDDAGLTDEAKARLRGKLEHWVVEDAPVAT